METRKPLPFAALALCAAACAGNDSATGAGDASAVASRAPAAAPPHAEPGDHAVYELPLRTLEGEPTSLAEHEGRALLLVNVASECGLTPQYAGLQKLHETYGPRGLVVVGFPCNQFGGQEPGTAEEIRGFCDARYGVTFPMMEKIEVNGPGRHPLYRELTAAPDASGAAGDVQWNFEKFVVSADRETVRRFRPKTAPDDPALVEAIEDALP